MSCALAALTGRAMLVASKAAHTVSTSSAGVGLAPWVMAGAAAGAGGVEPGTRGADTAACVLRSERYRALEHYK